MRASGSAATAAISGQVSPPSNDSRSHATCLPGLGSSYSFQLSYGSASAPSPRAKTGPVTAQPTSGRTSTSRNGPQVAPPLPDSANSTRIGSTPAVSGLTKESVGSDLSTQAKVPSSRSGASSVKN